MPRARIFGSGLNMGGVQPAGGGVTYLLRDEFIGAGTGVALLRNDISGASIYHLLQHLGGNECWSLALENQSISPPGTTLHVLSDATIRVICDSIDDDAGTVTKTGTWINTADGTFYGGDSARCTVAGGDIQWTTPAATTAVGMRGSSVGNVGIHKVSIDGDATLANLCLTAQQLVDAGVLASTALVANGGLLNPTDRVFDQHTAPPAGQAGAAVGDTWRLFAKDLSPGVHTVRIDILGYKNSGSSDFRLYIGGFLYATADMSMSGLGSSASAGRVAVPAVSLLSTDSVYEYALRPQPSGATIGGSDFVGNGHGYDIPVSIDFAVDGTPVTPSSGTATVGSTSIEIVRVSELRHRETSTTKQADVTVTYTMTPANGLQIVRDITWREPGNMIKGYVAMFPFNQAIDKCSSNGSSADYLLNDNDSSFKADAATNDFVYAWDADGYYALAMYVPNLATAVNNYAGVTTQKFAVEDRVGGTMNKIYLNRADNAAYADDEHWVSDTRYYAQRFPNGANAALARS